MQRPLFIRATIVTLCFGVSAFAGQSIVLPAAMYGTAAGISAGNTSALSMGIEVRISNWTIPTGGNSNVFGSDNGFQLVWLGNSNTLRLYSPQDSGPSGNQCDLNAASHPDFVVRFQRDVAAGVLTCEAWDKGGLKWYSDTRAISSFASGISLSSIQLGRMGYEAGAVNSRIALARFFTGQANILPMNSIPPHGLLRVGNLVSFEFENNVGDSSGAGRNLSITNGPVSYAATDISSPPVCNAGARQTIRAGYAGTLDGSLAYSLDDSYSLSYIWTELSGPSSVRFSSGARVKNPTAHGFIFGSYVFGLTITDGSGKTSNCTVKHGAVSTDASGSVIIPNVAHRKILGNIPMYGTSPWPWLDQKNRDMAQLILDVMPTKFRDPWTRTPQGPGTITVLANGTQAIGIGTDFKNRFCAGGTTPPEETFLIIGYPSKLYPGTYGRRKWPIFQCTDDTHLELGRRADNESGEDALRRYYTTEAIDAGSGLPYWKLTNDLIADWGFGAAPANYYDNVQGLYVMFYRTGIDDYLYAARALADRWWRGWLVDRGGTWDNIQGYFRLEERSVSLTGLIMRQTDDVPPTESMWPGIKHIFDYVTWPLAVNGPVGDLRNEGYVSIWISLAVMFDDDPARVQAYRNIIKTDIATHMGNYRQTITFSDGTVGAYWRMNLLSSEYGIYSFNPLSNFGNGTSFAGLVQLTGTAHVTNGSNVVTGVGTNFGYTNGRPTGCATGYWLMLFPTGTTSIYTGSGGTTSEAKAWPIGHVTSSTQMELSSTYDGPTGDRAYGCSNGWGANGVQPYMLGLKAQGLKYEADALRTDPTGDPAAYALAPTAEQYAIQISNYLQGPVSEGGAYDSTAGGILYGTLWPQCGGGDGNCFQDEEARRVNFMELMYAYTLNYVLGTKTTALRNKIDRAVSVIYGKPGTIPVENQTAYITEDSRYALPLEGWFLTNPLFHPKWYGIAFATGGDFRWPSDRLGGVAAPNPTTLSMPFSLAAIPGATTLKVSVRKPDGTISSTNHTASPAAIPVDSTMGRHMMKVEYFNGSTRLAVGEWQVLPEP